MNQEVQHDVALDEDGFLTDIVGWDRDLAKELAKRNDIGPLTDDHWKIIEYVRDFYTEHKKGPPVVNIGKATGFSPKKICTLFECGIARGAYRLAGLPRPDGCV